LARPVARSSKRWRRKRSGPLTKERVSWTEAQSSYTARRRAFLHGRRAVGCAVEDAAEQEVQATSVD
jgi:hypothetical protein